MGESDRLGAKLLRYGLVLMAVCAASGTGVGVLYWKTRERIEQQHRNVFRDALRKAFPPDVTDVQPAPGQENTGEQQRIYVGLDGTGRPVAYATLGNQQGYQSEIAVVVAVKPAPGDANRIPSDPELLAIRVVRAQETPGLGQNIEKVRSEKTVWSALFGGGGGAETAPVPAFQAQFAGKRLSQLRVVKIQDPDAIVAVTGATISSRATTDAVSRAVEKMVAALGPEAGRVKQ